MKMRTTFSKLSFWRTIIICGIIQVVISIISKCLNPSINLESSWELTFICYGIMTTYIFSYSSYRLKDLKNDLIYLRDKEQLWCVLLVFMTQYFISVGGYQLVLSGVFYVNRPLAIQTYEEPIFYFTNQKELIFACATTSLIVPIFEELLFRGVFLSWLCKRFTVRLSLIIMALCFGFFHGIDFIGATMFGFLCGLLYVKFKNIWAPILVHLLNNTLACLSFLLGQEVHPPLEALTKIYISEQFKEGIVLFGVGIILLFFTLKRLDHLRLE